MLGAFSALLVAVLAAGLCAPPACAMTESPSAPAHGCCADGLRKAVPSCCGSRVAAAPAGLPTRPSWTAGVTPALAPVAPRRVFVLPAAAAALRAAPESHPPPLVAVRV